jgi:hypothetical protein
MARGTGRAGAAAMAAAAALALAGCEVNVGENAGAADEAGPVSAEGKAEAGRVTIKAPGFDMSVAIPEEVARRATADSRSGIIPPDARFSGVHVEGGRDGAAGGAVELRFSSAEPPRAVAAWYRDAARAEHFSIASAEAEGQGMRLSGTTARDGDPFVVHLAPGEGGGTDGRVAITGR